MADAGIRGYLNGAILLVFLIVALVLEFNLNIFERGVGHYLKWENHSRPQLGRIWEKERGNIVAQNKVQSIISNLNLQEQTSESIGSFKELFEGVTPSFPQLVSRKKFLQLYFDFPGKWSRDVISPIELLEVDANKDWDRVILSRFGQWITVSFIDRNNYPIRELFLSTDEMFEIQSTRTVKRGNLEEAGFEANLIYPANEFFQVLQTLDSKTQQALFPDPRWFLAKDYHIARIGVMEKSGEEYYMFPLLLGIEYNTEFYTDILLIPVPREVTNNMLSQIEGAETESLESPVSSLE